MKTILLAATLLLFSCSTPSAKATFTAEEERVMMNITNSNQYLNGKFRGLSGKSLKNLKLEDIKKKVAKKKSRLLVNFREILEESTQIKVFPREEAYVLCLHYKGIAVCDLSDCPGIEKRWKDKSGNYSPNEVACH